MKRIINFRFHFLFVLLLLGLSGCYKKTKVIPPQLRLLPVKDATSVQVFRDLQEQSGKIQTLTASVYFDTTTSGDKAGELTQYHQTAGKVVVQRPDHMRIYVQVPLVLSNLAVMVADGIRYKVWIPFKNQFGEGDVNAPIAAKKSLLNLRPKVFLDGLFVDIRPYLNKSSNVRYFPEEAVLGTHRYFVYTFLDITSEAPEAQVLEKIWVDRTDLQIWKKQLFGKDGSLETDVEYQNYQPVSGVSVPQTLIIQRPMEEFTVKMTLQIGSVKLNEKIDPANWDLQRPEGSQILELTQAVK